MSVKFCNYHGREKLAGCFTPLCLVTVSVLWPFLMVPLVGLLCAIVVFAELVAFLA